jgi:hypothetical protein
LNWEYVHRVWALVFRPRKQSLGAQTLCIVLLLVAATPIRARADCPAAPIAAPDDMAISFLAANGVQAASASLLATSVKEGTLVYDDANDALKLCDGTNWVDVGSGGATQAAGDAGQIQFNDGADALAADGALYWDNTNKRLGIGLSVPTTTLEVSGAARISGGVGIGIAPNVTYPLYVFGSTAAALGARVQNTSTANGAAARFYVTSDTADGAMTVFSSGTTGSWGGVPLANRFFFNQSSTGSGISFSANGAAANVTFHTGGSLERMRIESNGNVGIGAAVPGNKLEITQGTAGNSGLRFTNLTSGSTAGTSNGKVLSVNANGDVVLVDAASGSATAAGTVAGAVQFRGATAVLAADDVNLIWDDTNNRLGIGTAAPAHALDVAGFINTNAASGYKQDGNTILRTTPGPGAQGVLIGHQAGANLATFATGHADVFIGRNAGAACINCTTSVAIGFNAMTATVGKPGGAELTDHADTTNNVAIGAYAMGATTGYPQHAVAIGYGSQSTVGNTKYNVSVGYQAMETTTPGDSNVAIGAKTLRTGSGQDYSTAIGWLALTGASGDSNTCVGAFCLQAVSSGIRNTAIGTLAGDTISTGSYNLMLGYNTVPNISPSSSYQINIGNAIYGYNGKIGIGALNPGNKFEITHGTAGNSGLRFTNLNSSSTSVAANGKALSVDANGDVILVDAASGSTAAAGDAGQIQFNDGADALAADSALHWDNTNKRLGIGTNTPAYDIDIIKSPQGGQLALRYGAHGTVISGNNLRRDVGSVTGHLLLRGYYDNNDVFQLGYEPSLGGSGTTTGLKFQYGTRAATLSPAGYEAQMGFYPRGVNTPTLFMTHNGNVGIGTTAPTSKLTINSSSTSIPPILVMANADGGDGGAIKLQDPNGDHYLKLKNQAYVQHIDVSGDLSFGQNGTSRMRVQANTGNVGIGTTTPQSKLQVAGGIQLGNDAATCPGTSDVKLGTLRYNSGNLELCTSGGWGDLGGSASVTAAGDGGQIQFNDGADGLAADAALYWDNTNKRVGIGTATPSYPLDILSTTLPGLRIRGNSAASLGAALHLIGTNTLAAGSQTTSLVSYQPTGGGPADAALDIRVRKEGDAFDAPNTVMTVLGSGKVGIGTTTPAVTLHTNGGFIRTDGTSAFGLQLYRNGASIGSITTASIRLSVNDVAGNGIQFLNSSAAANMMIENGGNVGIGTTTPQSKLQVTGGIQLGDDTATCPGTSDVKLGTLRYNSGNLELCTSGGWGDLSGSTVAEAAGDAGQIQFNDGADALAADANLHWDNTNKRLGIGTATPTETLDVNGTARVLTQLTTAGPGGAFLSLRAMGAPADQKNVVMAANTSGELTIYNANDANSTAQVIMQAKRSGLTTTSVLFPSGNVGIGTNNPAAPLDIAGDARSTTGFRLIQAGVDYGMRNLNNGVLSFGTWTATPVVILAGGTDRLTVMQNGNVGIGTATGPATWPQSKLHVAGTAADIAMNSGDANLVGLLSNGNRALSRQAVYFNHDGVPANNDMYLGSAFEVVDGVSAAAPTFRTAGSGFVNPAILRVGHDGFAFLTSTPATVGTVFTPGEVMRITNAGNVGVGTAAPQSLLSVGPAGYAQFEKMFAGTPTAGDCDAANEAGRVTYDTTNNVWYVCEGTGGWSIAGGPASGTSVAFAVSKGANQSVSSGANTLITWSGETFDTNNNFSSNRFTPTVPGKYLISLAVGCSSSTNCQSLIYKNGASIARGIDTDSASGPRFANATIVVDMNGTTDYVEGYGFTIGTSIVSSDTFFSGSLLASGGGGSGGGGSSQWSDGTSGAIYYDGGNVGIGTVLPDASAILDLTSTTKGLRLPRPTTDASVTSPVEGLLIYDDTANVLKFRNASAWVTLGSGGGATPTANAGYVQISNGSALVDSGTTAGQQLFWDNTSKRLGIGTATPIANLHVRSASGANSGLVIDQADAAAGNRPVLYFAKNGAARVAMSTDGLGYYTDQWNGTATTNRMTISNDGQFWFRGAAGATEERLYIGATGNVGIGTVSPTAKLEINTVGANTSPLVIRTNASAGNYTPTNSAIIVKDAAGGEILRLFGSDTDVTNNYNSGNLFLGYQAGLANPTDNTSSGYQNTAIGYQTLKDNTTGFKNTAVGFITLPANTTGARNTAYGAFSLYDNTSGDFNTALGFNTAGGITTGRANTVLGANVTGLAAGLNNNIIIADGDGNRRINVDANGNVGIGTATPTGRLQIGETTANTSNMVIFGETIESSHTNLPRIHQTSGVVSVGNDLAIGATSSVGGIAFYTGNGTPSGLLGTSSNTVKMAIATNGNVGIGTTNPQSLLQVAGSIQLGNDTAACPGASNVKVGALRYNSGSLQLCSPGGWASVSAGGASSLSTNGYQALPSGLIMQWGYAASCGSNCTVTVTYPIAFTTATYSVQITATGPAVVIYAPMVTSTSTTQFSADTAAGSSTKPAVFWTAIGK